MLTKFIVVALAMLVESRAPYAPSGWQPKIPFNLPNEYLPPHSRGTTVEITRARVVPLNPSVNIDVTTQKPRDNDSGFTIIYPDEEDTSTSSPSNIKEGRYFIISPEKKLQRVIYRTLQNQDDGNEDFIAQLKYSTVGEVNDPIYRSNNQGQLERVLK
ncbi:uncharacterized protein LOC6639769 [Drosophila willistoni]|uniref:uncharacterized protein LOC6639769 n=1 Tax=Drosophila willistoni TaxID=7260 RepID=UPI00017D6AAE|nr:uncharacterized protein LOC6639769 [Drosophila willistoni]